MPEFDAEWENEYQDFLRQQEEDGRMTNQYEDWQERFHLRTEQ